MTPRRRPIRRSAAPARRWFVRVSRAGLVCAAAALAGLPASGPAAQPSDSAPSASQQGQAFSVAAGPLAQVVAQVASAAGVALSFDAAPLAHLRSPGLQGRYSVEAGLAKVLEGTGLQAVRGAGGAYTLRALPEARQGEPAPSARTLATVTVSAAAPATADAATTERSQSHAASTVTLFQGAQPVRGIPQPVSVATRQWMDDRALRDLHDVLQQAPGIAVDYTDSERVTYWSRGHQIDTLQVDGLAMQQNSSASIFIQPDTAVLDRVEILRGAAGVLRGAGNPSATVNLVRKRPAQQFQASAGLSLGSWDRRRVEADVSAPLNAAGTVRGRLIAVSDSQSFFQQAREQDRQLVYAVAEAALGPRTTFTASLQHTALDATGAWGGLPAAADGSPLGLPRSTYLGTDWNRWDRHNQQAFAELAHRLDNGWTARLSAAHTRLRTDGFKQTSFSSASAGDPYLVNVSTSIYGADASTQNAVSLVASGPFEAFGRQHELTVGADTQRVTTAGTSGHWGVSPLLGVDLRRGWNPYTSYPEPFYTPGNGTAFTAESWRTQQHGLYGTARVSLSPRLTAIAGGRLSWWSHDVPANTIASYRMRHQATPYAGLVYELSDRLSAYASYSEIFAPQNLRDASGAVIAPVRGEDFEAGLKADALDGRLNASLSVFRIHTTGKAEPDAAATATASCVPVGPTSDCYSAGGKNRSEGWELEVAGEPAPGWQATASYTYTRTRTLQSSVAGSVGQPLRSVDPRHVLRLFGTHRLNDALQDWTLGAGARLHSDGYSTVGNATARQGGYALLDAMVRWRLGPATSVQLNVNNLLDKTYFSKFSPNSTYFNNYYGDPRNVTLSLRAEF
ncbi:MULTISPECIES: TonB-dependent siderophore receptor [unclassified Acidovorax]|uniref:TonB-dependent siderophore receptor n=1 Tax=unclassified Acidovorax TaxID=2684926 RepID=UPI00288310E2|nr:MULTISPECIES: TonB-dependent siderophore receptor [unclassified Acidovorax]